MVTSSSAEVGWRPIVASSWAFVHPAGERRREALDDLRRVDPDHVKAENAVGRAVDDELHHGSLLTAGERVFHRAEARSVDDDGAVLLARLLLGEAHRGDGRL